MEWQQAFLVLQEHKPEPDIAATAVAPSPVAPPSSEAPPLQPPSCEGPPLPPPAAAPAAPGADRLRAAVAWASGSVKLPSDSAARIATLLSPEAASTVVARHEASVAAPKTTSAVAAPGPRLLGKKGGAITLKARLADAA